MRRWNGGGSWRIFVVARVVVGFLAARVLLDLDQSGCRRPDHGRFGLGFHSAAVPHHSLDYTHPQTPLQ